MWKMSQTEGLTWRVQRGESFKESLKELEGSKVWPNLSREKVEILSRKVEKKSSLKSSVHGTRDWLVY